MAQRQLRPVASGPGYNGIERSAIGPHEAERAVIEGLNEHLSLVDFAVMKAAERYEV